MYKHSNEYCKIICNDIIVCWLKPQKFGKAELLWFFYFTEEGGIYSTSADCGGLI